MNCVLSPFRANSRARLPLRKLRCTLLPCSQTWARKYSFPKRWKTNFTCFDSFNSWEGIAAIITAFRPSALCTLIINNGVWSENVNSVGARRQSGVLDGERKGNCCPQYWPFLSLNDDRSSCQQ